MDTMESIQLDVYTFLTQKLEPFQLDLESVVRQAKNFQKENPECMTLELPILLAYLHTSPLQRPDLRDLTKAQEILTKAENDVKEHSKSLYNDEIEEAEVQNGYLFIIFNFLLSVSEEKLLAAESYKRCRDSHEKVRRACSERSAAFIHAFIAFAIYIFGEKSLMELALDRMTKALENQDVPKNSNWLYIKALILDKMMMPTFFIANTTPVSIQDNFQAELVSLYDDLQHNDKYKDWAAVMKSKYLSSNEETSVQSALTNTSVTTRTIISCAKVCLKQGECNRAKELLEGLPEKSDEILFLLGYASKNLSTKHNEPSPNSILSTEQTQQHHLEDALLHFEGAITYNKNNLGARMHKAITLALLGKAEESRKELQTLKFLLSKRKQLAVNSIVFHAEVLKLEKCLGLSNSQIQECVQIVVENSVKNFDTTKEEKKRVHFSVEYINSTVDMVLEKLKKLHNEQKENSDIAKTLALVLLKLQLYKQAKRIYKLLHTKLQEVYDPDVVLGLAKAYHALRETAKVQELINILKRDERMAHLADKITEEFGQPTNILLGKDNNDQVNYQIRERTRSFSADSALPCQSVSGQRSGLTRRVSGDVVAALTTTRTEGKNSENGSSSLLQQQRSFDNIKGMENPFKNDQTKLPDSLEVISTRKLSLVAGTIASKRKEFAREFLCLKEQDIRVIEDSNRDDSKEAAFQMLYKWTEENGLKATTYCLDHMLKSSKIFSADVLHDIMGILGTGGK